MKSYKKLRPGNQGLPEPNRLAVLEARRRGATFAEAAAAGKCSIHAAHNACKKAGFLIQKCKRIPAAEVARAVELYESDWMIAAIAKEMGRSVGSIDGIIRRHNLYRGSPRGNPLPPLALSAVLAKRRKGGTLAEAAAAGKCSVYAAWAACREAGLRLGKGRGRRSGPGRRIDDADRAGILADAAAGLTAFESADARGLQLAKVLEVLRSSGRPNH
jgi:hypothetical protein